MIGRSTLIEIARKGMKLAAFRRRADEVCSSSTSVARKGHLFVYSADGKRFTAPLHYLNSNIFQELFRISEEEFGLKSDGPITLPCDVSDEEHILSLLRCQISRDVEIRDALESVINAQCTAYRPRFGHCQQHQIIYGY